MMGRLTRKGIVRVSKKESGICILTEFMSTVKHCLNLSIVHACSEQTIRNMMTTVQDVAFLFSYSAKKICKFQESLDITQHELFKRKTLRDLCKTSSSERADALFTFLNAFDVTVDALEDLQEDADDKARGRL